jgi:hypothetical protein
MTSVDPTQIIYGASSLFSLRSLISLSWSGSFALPAANTLKWKFILENKTNKVDSNLRIVLAQPPTNPSQMLPSSHIASVANRNCGSIEEMCDQDQLISLLFFIKYTVLRDKRVYKGNKSIIFFLMKRQIIFQVHKEHLFEFTTASIVFSWSCTQIPTSRSYYTPIII